MSGPALIGSRIPYDPLKDFVGIGLINYVPYGLAVTASLPANDIKELIAAMTPGLRATLARTKREDLIPHKTDPRSRRRGG